MEKIEASAGAPGQGTISGDAGPGWVETRLAFAAEKGNHMYLSLITAFLLILGTTIFSLQNGKSLEVNFLAWNFETSLLGIVLCAVFVGALIVAVFAFPSVIRSHLREKRLVRQVRALEKEVEKNASPAPPLPATPPL